MHGEYNVKLSQKCIVWSRVRYFSHNILVEIKYFQILKDEQMCLQIVLFLFIRSEFSVWKSELASPKFFKVD